MTTSTHATVTGTGRSAGQMAALSSAPLNVVPIADDYAMQPIAAGFNWAECLAGIDAGQWYLVVFRSVRRATADIAALTAYDDAAHEEALQASGLLFYFKGNLGPSRACLSFCLWESREHARHASALPLHRAAMHAVDEMYDSYQLERYIVAKRAGLATPAIEPLPDDVATGHCPI